nr:reverse transcriptase domain-containing protein [Tanacetum cinerariifolium]
MRTRSRSRHKITEPLRNEFHFQEDQFQEDPPEDPMADNRTMAQLLQPPTVGYEDAIVIPKITATNFELKHGLINLVQNKQFFRHDKEDPHAHIRYFNKITSTMRVPNVPNSMIKLMLFPFSLEGAARIRLKKEPPRSILTRDGLVSKFINQFFPPSKTTYLRNEITRFQQRFDGLFSEAWDRFNDLLRACPHHGFSELHQLDTFYNALNVNDQDSLNSAAGGNFLDKMPSDCLKIIESKSKVLQSRAKAVVAKANSNSSTPTISSDVAELKDMVRAFCPATSGNVYQDNIHEYVSQAAAANYNQGNTSFRPQMDSLNSAVGGNFLDKMPRECLKIIESKSKVRHSRAKAVVSKVSTSSSTPDISSDVAELKDMVRALLLDKKNQSSAPAPAPSLTHAPVKAVEPNCVTCGGAHSYQNCPATNSNVYRDNIQEYVSQAAATNYNQGNTSFRPQMVGNQIRPPGFPPHQNNQNNFNQGNNF